MSLAEFAQKVMSQGIAHSTMTDGRVWAIRALVSKAAADGLSQGSATLVDTVFVPVVEEINEYEAEAIGQNLRKGDLKLAIDGALTITNKTKLVCDGASVDVRQTIPHYQQGVVQHYTVYVTRPPEKV